MAMFLFKGKLVSNTCTNGGGQDARGVGGSGVHLSSPMHQECLKMQQFSQKTRMPWLLKRNIRIHTELSGAKERRDDEQGERRRRARGTSLHLEVSELKCKGEIPRPWPSTEMRKPFEAVGEWANQPVTVWTEWEPHRQARLQAFIPRTGLLVHWCPRKLGAGAMRTAEWSQGEDSCWPWGVSRTGWDGGNLLHRMLLKESHETIGSHKSRVQLPVG